MVAHSFSFAGFTFDSQSGLYRDGQRLPLAPIEIRVLAMLLEGEGRVVTKQALIDGVWHGAAVSDNSISRAVCAVRRHLREHCRLRIVQTVYRTGFCIAVPIGRAAVARVEDTLVPDSRPQLLASLRELREALLGSRSADLRHAMLHVERVERLLTGAQTAVIPGRAVV